MAVRIREHEAKNMQLSDEKSMLVVVVEEARNTIAELQVRVCVYMWIGVSMYVCMGVSVYVCVCM